MTGLALIQWHFGVRGHVHVTSATFSGFLTPRLQFGPIHSTKFTQPPFLHLVLGYPIPPLTADIICTCPLTVESVYRVDVCFRWNLPSFRIYPITHHPTVNKVAICPRGHLPKFRIYPKTGYPMNGFYCICLLNMLPFKHAATLESHLLFFVARTSPNHLHPSCTSPPSDLGHLSITNGAFCKKGTWLCTEAPALSFRSFGPQ